MSPKFIVLYLILCAGCTAQWNPWASLYEDDPEYKPCRGACIDQGEMLVDMEKDMSSDMSLDLTDQSQRDAETLTDLSKKTCEENQKVFSKTCVPCSPGTKNEAGDDPEGSNTECNAILCKANEYVDKNACNACPNGLTNQEGDDASQSDTTCEDACSMVFSIYCDEFEEAFIQAEEPKEGDRFGGTVALHGNILAVGVPFDDATVGQDGGNNSGAVYIFEREQNTWKAQGIIKASNAGADDLFGTDIGLHNKTLVVGSPNEDSRSTGIYASKGNGEFAEDDYGAVYIYALSGQQWREDVYIKPNESVFLGKFGRSVAIDGDLMAVSSKNEVHAYKRSGGNWAFEETLKPTSTNAAGQDFGAVINIQGTTMVISALELTAGGQKGEVYVYVRNNDKWENQAILSGDNTELGDAFGFNTSLDGDVLAVSASKEDSLTFGVNGLPNENAIDSGAVYLFARQGDAWTQTHFVKASNTETDDFFGSSLALKNGFLAVGASGEDSGSNGVNGSEDDNSLSGGGAVYTFKLSQGIWSQAAYIKPGIPSPSALFGASLEMDDSLLAIGSPQHKGGLGGINTPGGEQDGSQTNSGAVYIRRIGK